MNDDESQLGLPLAGGRKPERSRTSVVVVPDRHGAFSHDGSMTAVTLSRFLDRVRVLAVDADDEMVIDDDCLIMAAADVLTAESRRSLRMARDLAGLTRMLSHARVDLPRVLAAFDVGKSGREESVRALFARVQAVRRRLDAAHVVDRGEALRRGLDVVRAKGLPPYFRALERVTVRHVVEPTELELAALIQLARSGLPLLYVLPMDPGDRGRTSSTAWIATAIESAHDVLHLDLAHEELSGNGKISAFVDGWYGGTVHVPALTADLPVRVELLADAVSEARRIGGVVAHRWLRAPTPPRIVVALRTMDAHAQRIADAIRAFNIPVVMREGIPLADMPAGQTLLDLLALKRDGIPRERLLSVLSQRAFAFRREPDDVGRIARTLRRAAARSDIEDSTTPRGGYRHRLLRLQKVAQGDERLLNEIARASSAVADIERVVDELPARETLSGFLVAVESVATEFLVDDDACAHHLVLDLIKRLRRAERRVGSSSGAVELSTFSRFLSRALEEERVPMRADVDDAVEVAPLSSIYGRTFDHVMIADCVHGRLPRAERNDPLLSDNDKAMVNQAAGARVLRLVDDEVATSSPVSPKLAPELLAFLGAAAAASTSLFISAAVRDAKGREVAPSDFFEESLLALGYPADAIEAGPSVEEEIHPRLRAITLSRAIKDNVVPPGVDVPPWVEDVVARVADGASARSRYFLRKHTTSPHEVASPWAFQVGASLVEEHYGNLLGTSAQRALSPTRLEALAVCPFRGFVEHALRVDTNREAGQDADSRALGRLAHKALEVFYQERKTSGVSAARFNNDDAARLDWIIDDRAVSLREGRETGHLAALDANVRWLKRSLRRTVAALALSPPVPHAEPVAFELRIGVRGGESNNEKGPASVQVGERTFYLGGEIDRVDFVRDKAGRITSRVVVDYKNSTGAAVERKLKERDLFSKHFQIPLYLRLLEHHAKSAPGLEFAGYLVSLKDGAPSGVIGSAEDLRRRVTDDNHPAGLASGLGKVLLPILDGVIAPLEGPACRSCRVARICRHDDVHQERDETLVDALGAVEGDTP